MVVSSFYAIKMAINIRFVSKRYQTGGALSDKTRSDCGRGPVIIIKFKNDKLIILNAHLPESIEVYRERWV